MHEHMHIELDHVKIAKHRGNAYDNKHRSPELGMCVQVVQAALVMAIKFAP